MKCDEFANLGPDYLQGSLPKEAATAMEAHSSACATCAADVAMWHELGKLPELEPSPALKHRFDALLSAYEEGRWEHKKYQPAKAASPSWFSFEWLRVPLAQAAVLAIVLAGGFAAGKYYHTEPAVSGDMASLRQELRETRQLATLSLLQQQSASERLQGVSYSARSEKPDPEILAALMHTLKYDNSVDVRLAALDALRRYNNQPAVREGMAESLVTQNSPMVQIALIDMLVELKEARAAQQIRKLEQNPKLDPTVRQRARWGLAQLQG
ncbi:MAG TPA: hypothetical protein VMZ25_05505, partial [Terriglobales bacterium]|nr:hypothetical protein [Terriglobales bacterium]